MFLKNYYNLMQNIFLKGALKSTLSANTTLILSNGEPYNYSISYSPSSSQSAAPMLNPFLINYGQFSYSITENSLILIPSNKIASTAKLYPSSLAILFGSGTTPVAIDDYNLEQPISNIEYTAIDNNYTENSFTITITAHNLNSSEISVSEVCFFGNMAPAGFYSQIVSALYREVFDSPITVPADGYFKFSYTIQMTVS